MTGVKPGRALVVGLGLAGEAAARRLAERGWAVTVSEDRPSDITGARASMLAGRGVETVELPSPSALVALVAGSDMVVPSPGVPATHPAIVTALDRGTEVCSELELAARWSSLPMVAVTGTNGKTTVTTLIETMLRASGLRAVSASNNDLPLVDALARENELDVIVVEASSFRLQFTERFRPGVGVWLNQAEDHLDWHGTPERYAWAKARMWQAQEAGDVAVANAEDPAVMAWAAKARSRLVTFGLDRGDWRVVGDALVSPRRIVAVDDTEPGDEVLLGVDELWRSLPHDRVNALAASAAAMAAGASLEAVRSVLRGFRGLPHRLCLVAEHDGVAFYDDSKATDPHATATAVAGFPSVVLIAGGRNKGLDLSVLAAHSARLRAVVAIGEAGGDIEAAFAGEGVPVARASSMDEAVAAARAVARSGDAVVLSPGCASYDWYSSYRQRGDDFTRAVADSLGARP